MACPFFAFTMIRLLQAWDLVVPGAIVACAGAAVDGGQTYRQAENQTLISAENG